VIRELGACLEVLIERHGARGMARNSVTIAWGPYRSGFVMELDVACLIDVDHLTLPVGTNRVVGTWRGSTRGGSAWSHFPTVHVLPDEPLHIGGSGGVVGEETSERCRMSMKTVKSNLKMIRRTLSLVGRWMSPKESVVMREIIIAPWPRKVPVPILIACSPVWSPRVLLVSAVRHIGEIPRGSDGGLGSGEALTQLG
jgi:hypothetical protein